MGNFKFSIEDRHYDIRFNKFNIIFLVGNSGSGKTLFFKDLKEWVYTHNKENIAFITYESRKNDLLLLKQNIDKYDLIVVDRADLIIDDALDTYIYQHSDKDWIIIGRGTFGCTPSLGTIGYLKNKDGKIMVEYGVF